MVEEALPIRLIDIAGLRDDEAGPSETFRKVRLRTSTRYISEVPMEILLHNGIVKSAAIVKP
jgi:hypothetical protein